MFYGDVFKDNMERIRKHIMNLNLQNSDRKQGNRAASIFKGEENLNQNRLDSPNLFKCKWAQDRFSWISFIIRSYSVAHQTMTSNACLVFLKGLRFLSWALSSSWWGRLYLSCCTICGSLEYFSCCLEILILSFRILIFPKIERDYFAHFCAFSM